MNDQITNATLEAITNWRLGLGTDKARQALPNLFTLSRSQVLSMDDLRQVGQAIVVLNAIVRTDLPEQLEDAT